MSASSFISSIRESVDRIINSYVWVKPSASNEHEEVIYQLDLDKQRPFLPGWVRENLIYFLDFKNFSDAVETGRRVRLSRQQLIMVNNTGDTWKDTLRWEDNKEKIARVPLLFQGGNAIERPIILENRKTGDRHLISGHHRSTYVTDILGQEVEVQMIFSVK